MKKEEVNNIVDLNVFEAILKMRLLIDSQLLYFTVLLLISLFEYVSPIIYGFCLTERTFLLLRIIRSTMNNLI